MWAICIRDFLGNPFFTDKRLVMFIFFREVAQACVMFIAKKLLIGPFLEAFSSMTKEWQWKPLIYQLSSILTYGLLQRPRIRVLWNDLLVIRFDFKAYRSVCVQNTFKKLLILCECRREASKENLTGNNFSGCIYLYTPDTNKNPYGDTLIQMITNNTGQRHRKGVADAALSLIC